MHTIQAVEALAARSDGANDDALPDAVKLFESRSELLDDADWLMAQNKPGLDRVFTANDVHIRAADRRGRNPYDRLTRTRPWLRDFFDRNPILTLEHTAFIVFMMYSSPRGPAI